MGSRVFISYSSKDKVVGDAVCAILEQRGIRCWIAPRDILPGSEWGEAIINGLTSCQVFVLVFSVFFLFEVTASLRIHPLQYAMVGGALCLFFLGFLALSEIWAPSLAYGVAAGACTAMVALYALSFLRTGWRTLIIAAGLASTYGYLYFVLQSQDYALLAGTAALFATLALVMFCTRNINWYSLEASHAATGATKATG